MGIDFTGMYVHDCAPSRKYLAIDAPNQPREARHWPYVRTPSRSGLECLPVAKMKSNTLLDTLYNSLTGQRTGKLIEHN